MEPEGKHFELMGIEEFGVVFESVANGAKLKQVKERLSSRNPTTVARAYHVACVLCRRGTDDLSDREAEQIAAGLKYETTDQH